MQAVSDKRTGKSEAAIKPSLLVKIPRGYWCRLKNSIILRVASAVTAASYLYVMVSPEFN